MELCIGTMIRKILNFVSYYYTNSFKIVKKRIEEFTDDRKDSEAKKKNNHF